jgi:hypothetical protein
MKKCKFLLMSKASEERSTNQTIDIRFEIMLVQKQFNLV